jgi:hypothetical protein
VTAFARPLGFVPPPDLPCRSGAYRYASLPRYGSAKPQANLPRLLPYIQIHHNTRVPDFTASRCGIAARNWLSFSAEVRYAEVGYYVREDSAHENLADEIALPRARVRNGWLRHRIFSDRSVARRRPG